MDLLSVLGLKSTLLSSGSSLQTTSSASALKTNISVLGEDRKRKPSPSKSATDTKKFSVGKSSLQSSLLSSKPSLQSSLLSSSSLSTKTNLSGSGLGGLRSTGNLQSKTSSTLGSTGLQSNLLSKYEVKTHSRPTTGLSSSTGLSSLGGLPSGVSTLSSSLQTSVLTSRLTNQDPERLQTSLTGNLSSLSTKSALGGEAQLPLSRSSSKEEKPKKIRGQKRAAADENVFAIKKHTIKAPRYNLKGSVKDTAGIVIEDFVSPCKDPALSEIKAPLHDVNGIKVN